MKRLLAWVIPLGLAVGFSGFLKADDAVPPLALVNSIDFQAADAYVWYVEHSAAIAKDSDVAGVAAVLQVEQLFKGKDPQTQIDFLNKALFETKSHAVQRAIRMKLAELYKNAGQTDRALNQLQAIIDEAQ